jgi:putative transcription factor
MSLCEMCGKKDVSVAALVEGTELKVCNDCSKYGKVLRKIQQVYNQQNIKSKTEIKKQEEPEVIEVIIEGYGNLVKTAREKLGLTQDDFGKKINEKVSVIHSIESEHHEPNMELAKKLEKFLKIKIIEQIKDENKSFGSGKTNSLTIGDIIKIK